MLSLGQLWRINKLCSRTDPGTQEMETKRLELFSLVCKTNVLPRYTMSPFLYLKLIAGLIFFYELFIIYGRI